MSGNRKDLSQLKIEKAKKCRGVAQFGSARGLGPWGREFESLHPDHIKSYCGPLAQLVRATGS